MENHYFDVDGTYIGSASAHDASLPPENALRVQPSMEEGFWPVLNESRDGWVSVPDHRGRRGWLGDSEAMITRLGPLPAGWSDTRPESDGEKKYFLTAKGTYHAANCRYTASTGEWLTAAAVLERAPGAKACKRCRPGPLGELPLKEDA